MSRTEASISRRAQASVGESSRLTSRQIAGLGAGAGVAIALCFWLVDRPVASLAHEVLLPHRGVFDTFTHIVDPLPVIAWLICAGYVLLALGGVLPGPRGRLALRLAIALLVAVFLKDGLKGITGRSWPETWTNDNLSYIRDGIYGFFPWRGFNGTREFQAFPSGHLTVISVTVVGLALAFPRWKWLAAVPIVLVAVGMIGSNYHWVSDLIGGGALGAAVALAAHRLGKAFEESSKRVSNR